MHMAKMPLHVGALPPRCPKIAWLNVIPFSMRLWYFKWMKTFEIPVDGAGRLVLPKPIRNELGLRGGDILELESNGSTVTLKRGGREPKLETVNGVLVFCGTGGSSRVQPAELDVDPIAERLEVLTRFAVLRK